MEQARTSLTVRAERKGLVEITVETATVGLALRTSPVGCVSAAAVRPAPHARHPSLPHRPGDDAVLRAGEEERGLTDLCPVPWCGEIPITIKVAIPVQAAAKAGPAIILDEVCDFASRDPGRQLSLDGRIAKEAKTVLQEHLQRTARKG